MTTMQTLVVVIGGIWIALCLVAAISFSRLARLNKRLEKASLANTDMNDTDSDIPEPSPGIQLAGALERPTDERPDAA